MDTPKKKEEPSIRVTPTSRETTSIKQRISPEPKDKPETETSILKEKQPVLQKEKSKELSDDSLPDDKKVPLKRLSPLSVNPEKAIRKSLDSTDFDATKSHRSSMAVTPHSIPDRKPEKTIGELIKDIIKGKFKCSSTIDKMVHVTLTDYIERIRIKAGALEKLVSNNQIMDEIQKHGFSDLKFVSLSENKLVFNGENKNRNESVLIKCQIVDNENELDRIQELFEFQKDIAENLKEAFLSNLSLHSAFKLNLQLEDKKFIIFVEETEKADSSLADIIEMKRREGLFFSDEEMSNIFFDLLKALLFLNAVLNISHCNIKPSNIFYSKQQRQYYFAHFLGAKSFTGAFSEYPATFQNMTLKGTPKYMSPSMKKFMASEGNAIDLLVVDILKNDLYSLGLVLLELNLFNTNAIPQQTIDDAFLSDPEQVQAWAKMFAVNFSNTIDINVLELMFEEEEKIRENIIEIAAICGIKSTRFCIEGPNEFSYENVFMKNSDIVSYQGELDADGKFMATGTFNKIWLNKQTLRYEGAWKAGLPHGEGVLHYNEYLFFRGSFSKGLRSGHGDLFYGGEQVHGGEWKDDIMIKFFEKSEIQSLEEFSTGFYVCNFCSNSEKLFWKKTGLNERRVVLIPWQSSDSELILDNKLALLQMLNDFIQRTFAKNYSFIQNLKLKFVISKNSEKNVLISFKQSCRKVFIHFKNLDSHPNNNKNIFSGIRQTLTNLLGKVNDSLLTLDFSKSIHFSEIKLLFLHIFDDLKFCHRLNLILDTSNIQDKDFKQIMEKLQGLKDRLVFEHVTFPVNQPYPEAIIKAFLQDFVVRELRLTSYQNINKILDIRSVNFKEKLERLFLDDTDLNYETARKIFQECKKLSFVSVKNCKEFLIKSKGSVMDFIADKKLTLPRPSQMLETIILDNNTLDKNILYNPKMSYFQGLGRENIKLFSTNKNMKKLIKLDISQCGIDIHCLKFISSAEFKLRELNLEGNHGVDDAAAAIVLEGANAFKYLKALNLSKTSITDDSILVLELEASIGKNLEGLAVNYCAVSEKAVSFLFTNSCLQRLVNLELDGITSVTKALKNLVKELKIFDRRMKKLSLRKIEFEGDDHVIFMDFVSNIRFYFSKLRSLKIDDKISALLQSSSNFKSNNIKINEDALDPYLNVINKVLPHIERKKNWYVFLDNLITKSRKEVVKQVGLLDLSLFGALLYDSQFEKIATLLPYLGNLEIINLSATDISWTSLENIRATVLPYSKRLNIVDLRRCKLLMLDGNPEDFFRKMPCVVFVLKNHKNEELLKVAATTDKFKTSFWIVDLNLKLMKDIEIHKLDNKHHLIDLANIRRPFYLPGLFNHTLSKFISDEPGEFPILQKHNPLLRDLEPYSFVKLRVGGKHFHLANNCNENAIVSLRELLRPTEEVFGTKCTFILDNNFPFLEEGNYINFEEVKLVVRIPVELSSCLSTLNFHPQLKELDVKLREPSTNEVLEKLFDRIKKAKGIEDIKICVSHQKIDPNLIGKHLLELFEDSNLKNLDLCLKNCSVDDKVFQIFLSVLSKLSQKLVSLRLDLENNDIQQSGEALFNTIVTMTNLKNLDLNFSRNPCSGEFSKLLERLVGINLEGVTLNFRENPIKELRKSFLSKPVVLLKNAGFSAISEAISKFQNILTLNLNLERNAILALNPEKLKILLQSASLQELKLNLRGNKIPYQDLLGSTQIISQKAGLQLLWLNLGEIGCGGDMIQLLSNLLIIKCLKVLNVFMDSNSHTFNNEDMSSLLPENASSLESLALCLSKNQINDKAVKLLSKVLGSLKDLKFLRINMEDCNLGKDEAELFFKKLEEMKGLQQLTLKLAKNRVSQSARKFFNATMKDLSYLGLDLSINDIENLKSNDPVDSLHSWFDRFSELMYLKLKLSNNSIKEKDIKEISVGISKLSTLKYLKLVMQNNYLDLPKIMLLLEYITKGRQLMFISLDIRFNNITKEDEAILSERINKIQEERKNLRCLLILSSK